MSLCERCFADKEDCVNCSMNPIYEKIPKSSKFKPYPSVCPLGFKDCSCDPSYIKYNDPLSYSMYFGEIDEVKAAENTCLRFLKEHPNAICYHRKEYYTDF